MSDTVEKMKKLQQYKQEKQNKDSIICPGTGKNNGCVLYKQVQDNTRSSSDVSEFKKGREQYLNVVSIFTKDNIQPTFKSHTDYLVWKRMNTQLNSK